MASNQYTAVHVPISPLALPSYYPSSQISTNADKSSANQENPPPPYQVAENDLFPTNVT
jgi:hypothetical protein